MICEVKNMQKKIEWLKFTEEEKEERKKLKEDEEWRNNWTHKDFERYGGQYVAIRNKSVVAAAKTLEELQYLRKENDLSWNEHLV